MKTNQIMTRPMGQFNVVQRTKDSMFNATNLIKQWNEVNGTTKELKHYLENQATQEFIQTIYEKEFLNTPKNGYLESIDNQGVVNGRNSAYLKKGIISTTRGKNGGTWMHPMLFIDFAMWLNPRFKYEVLKFVSDQMLSYRDKSGEYYKKLSSAVQSILLPHEDMKDCIRRVANGLNYIVFGDSSDGERNNHGTQEKMEELFILEKKLTELIQDGFIKTFKDLMSYMRKLYNEKNPIPTCFVQEVA